MARGSQDPPRCQSNLDRLKQWLDTGQKVEQSAAAAAIAEGWRQHNVIHEHRAKAQDLVTSALVLLGDAAAIASNKRLQAEMTELQRVILANSAKEVDYQRRILLGASNQMDTASTAHYSPQIQGLETDDLMGVPTEHSSSLACARVPRTQQQVTLHLPGLGCAPALGGSGPPTTGDGYPRRPLPRLDETSSEDDGPPPLVSVTSSDEDFSDRGEEESEPEATTQARANGQIR